MNEVESIHDLSGFDFVMVREIWIFSLLLSGLSSIKTTNQLLGEAKTLPIVFSKVIRYGPIMSTPSFAKYLSKKLGKMQY